MKLPDKTSMFHKSTYEDACIFYKSGYKYQLYRLATFRTRVYPERDLQSDYISLSPSGLLLVEPGYAWDGASGPAIDTKNFMRASLAHDALYQLIREQKLPARHRKAADEELYRIATEDGMTKFRAYYAYLACRTFGHMNAKPDMRPVKVAP